MLRQSSPGTVREIREYARTREALAEQLAELQEQLATAHVLIRVYQRASLGEVPPSALVHALRGGLSQAAAVADGQRIVIGLAPVARQPDPVAEAEAWQAHLDAHRLVRSETIVPGAIGLRPIELPEGHLYQAWRIGGIATATAVIVVNRWLPRWAARGAIRAARRAVSWP